MLCRAKKKTYYKLFLNVNLTKPRNLDALPPIWHRAPYYPAPHPKLDARCFLMHAAPALRRLIDDSGSYRPIAVGPTETEEPAGGAVQRHKQSGTRVRGRRGNCPSGIGKFANAHGTLRFNGEIRVGSLTSWAL